MLIVLYYLLSSKGDEESVNYERQSRLDRLWYGGGTNQLKRYFSQTARSNTRQALSLVNDEDLRFPVLFILTDEIYSFSLFGQLSVRNQTAIRVCAFRTMPAGWLEAAWEGADRDSLIKTLRWMLATGKGWDGPQEGHDVYDAALDYAAALLTDEFDDAAALPDIADLIFRRNRKSFYIHDLVWSFFQTLDADAMKLVAARLKSSNTKDVELAGKLLGIDIPSPTDRRKQVALYDQYIRWLDENKAYLYLTGEHFQMTSQPNHLDFDREAKYLNKAISPRWRTPKDPLTDDEAECLAEFRKEPDDERELLASYSQKLRARDRERWDNWMKSRVAEQVMAARKDAGADVYY